MPAVVDLEKCDGCGSCVEECPVECISLEGEGDEKHAVVNAEECTDCETCVDTCEKGAISMMEVE
ncbi:ferredoxin [ANME-1 cluster archaeon ex4572_4]|nr:ferredoxin family protein [Methanophagales archaeon]OYT66468.1 MAG: ferredoxin [ANME-1 cluster archaeon ex4572_4]PXF50976.1 MAG: ferredoxin [Methanophagales archaeon]HDN68282.1 ferredoxin family protein [Methanomicrobia archaeon]